MARQKPVQAVFGELHSSAREGFRHAPFKMAFWIGVVVFGGLGIWFEVYNLVKEVAFRTTPLPTDYLRPLRIAVAVFFPAIAGGTSLQMVFEENPKAHKGFAVCAALLFLLCLIPTTDRELPDGFGLAMGVALSGISLWIWCAANGRSATYHTSPDAPLGEKPLDEPMSGDTDLATLTH